MKVSILSCLLNAVSSQRFCPSILSYSVGLPECTVSAKYFTGTSHMLPMDICTLTFVFKIYFVSLHIFYCISKLNITCGPFTTQIFGKTGLVNTRRYVCMY